MRLILHSLQDNITSTLLHSQKSYGQIAFEFRYCKATISRLAKNVNPDRENLKGGMPKKLTTTGERTIISQINTGKAENVVEGTKKLNNIIGFLVLTQIIQKVLKNHSMKAVVKKKKLVLSI
jgi:hypothetical protein